MYVILKVSEGLLHISKLNYVHRSIKAANILITDNCTCKVGGFGYLVKMKEGTYFETQSKL